MKGSESRAGGESWTDLPYRYLGPRDTWKDPVDTEDRPYLLTPGTRPPPTTHHQGSFSDTTNTRLAPTRSLGPLKRPGPKEVDPTPRPTRCHPIPKTWVRPRTRGLP